MSEQLSLLEIIERPSLEALFKPDALYETDDVVFLSSLPEDTRFERKSHKVSGATLATLLSAFGNGPAVEGGVVAIGIADDGTIEGCKGLTAVPEGARKGVATRSPLGGASMNVNISSAMFAIGLLLVAVVCAFVRAL